MNRLIVVVASVLVIGCSSGAQLVVVNDSDVRLVDVVATVEGRSTQIGLIETHSQGQGTVYPRGKSGAVRLTFSAGDKPVTSEQPICVRPKTSNDSRIDFIEVPSRQTTRAVREKCVELHGSRLAARKRKETRGNG